MKKIISLMLIVVITLMTASCGKKEAAVETAAVEETTAVLETTAVQETEASTEAEVVEETKAEVGPAIEIGNLHDTHVISAQIPDIIDNIDPENSYSREPKIGETKECMFFIAKKEENLKIIL